MSGTTPSDVPAARAAEQVPAVPAGRYGAPPSTRGRLVARLAIGLLAAVAVGVVAWIGLSAGSDRVQWQDVGYVVHDAGSIDIQFQVVMRPGDVAECRVHALSSRFAEVGVRDVVVGPSDSRVVRQTETIATSERAVTAVVERCTPREG